jgi:hypothetical protein
MHTNKYAATIAHNVSSKKRIEILARAKVLNVKWVEASFDIKGMHCYWPCALVPQLFRVTNAAARLRTEEA